MECLQIFLQVQNSVMRQRFENYNSAYYLNYRYWQVPYFWAGIKMYDLVAGKQKLKNSYLLSKEKALETFPMLKRDKLKAAIVYYDGKI